MLIRPPALAAEQQANNQSDRGYPALEMVLLPIH
jgi:hypothetical protein